MSLVINRFKYKIVHNSPTLRISVKNRLFFSNQAHFVFGKLSEVANSEATKKLMQELPQNYKEIKSRINFDFDETEMPDNCSIKANIEIPFLKRAYTKAAITSSVSK
jgi:hypothetical protein